MPNKSSPYGGRIESGYIVSQGTLLTSDLLRTFVHELERVKPFGEYALRQEALGFVNEGDSEAAVEVLADIIDSLDTIAQREGLTFGALPGDGACFGYWEIK